MRARSGASRGTSLYVLLLPLLLLCCAARAGGAPRPRRWDERAAAGPFGAGARTRAPLGGPTVLTAVAAPTRSVLGREHGAPSVQRSAAHAAHAGARAARCVT
jgi:hypothetical protein